MPYVSFAVLDVCRINPSLEIRRVRKNGQLEEMRVKTFDYSEYKTEDELLLIVKKFWENVMKISELAPEYWFGDNFYSEIYSGLLLRKFYVRNRIEKYYCFCFAIDFHPMYVWSKNCETKIFDWKGVKPEDFKDKEVVLVKPPENCNENPVIKFLDAIYGPPLTGTK